MAEFTEYLALRQLNRPAFGRPRPNFVRLFSLGIYVVQFKVILRRAFRAPLILEELGADLRETTTLVFPLSLRV